MIHSLNSIENKDPVVKNSNDLTEVPQIRQEIDNVDSTIKSDKVSKPTQLNKDIPSINSIDFSIWILKLLRFFLISGLDKLVNKIVEMDIINMPNGNWTILSA